MEHLQFLLKVAVAILVINQVSAVSSAINKNYTGI